MLCSVRKAVSRSGFGNFQKNIFPGHNMSGDLCYITCHDNLTTGGNDASFFCCFGFSCGQYSYFFHHAGKVCPGEGGGGCSEIARRKRSRRRRNPAVSPRRRRLPRWNLWKNRRSMSGNWFPVRMSGNFRTCAKLTRKKPGHCSNGSGMSLPTN